MASRDKQSWSILQRRRLVRVRISRPHRNPPRHLMHESCTAIRPLDFTPSKCWLMWLGNKVAFRDTPSPLSAFDLDGARVRSVTLSWSLGKHPPRPSLAMNGTRLNPRNLQSQDHHRQRRKRRELQGESLHPQMVPQSRALILVTGLTPFFRSCRKARYRPRTTSVWF